MQIILTLLMTAMSLLTQVNSNPNVSPEFRQLAVSVANQAITLANESLTIQPVSGDASSTPMAQPIVVPLVQQVFGSTLTTNQQIMDTPLECTLSADSNVGAPSSLVTLTWTSNAESATISNNHVVMQPVPTLDPVSGGSKKFQLSSETGENNEFTAHFVLKGQSKDCTVSVLTQ